MLFLDGSYQMTFLRPDGVHVEEGAPPREAAPSEAAARWLQRGTQRPQPRLLWQRLLLLLPAAAANALLPPGTPGTAGTFLSWECVPQAPVNGTYRALVDVVVTGPGGESAWHGPWGQRDPAAAAAACGCARGRRRLLRGACAGRSRLPHAPTAARCALPAAAAESEPRRVCQTGILDLDIDDGPWLDWCVACCPSIACSSIACS